jgi:hypothetical protein
VRISSEVPSNQGSSDESGKRGWLERYSIVLNVRKAVYIGRNSIIPASAVFGPKSSVKDGVTQAVPVHVVQINISISITPNPFTFLPMRASGDV